MNKILKIGHRGAKGYEPENTLVSFEKAIETDSKLQTILDAEIKGAEEVKLEWTSDEGCVSTMRLDKTRLEKMMGVKFE